MMWFKDSLTGSVLLLIAFTYWINARGSDAFGTFGFDVHHRYSDKVREFLDIDGLPEKNSLDYFNAMAHRDLFFKSRRLATTPAASTDLLTFYGSNQTVRISSLGFLHYSVVQVGTPSVPYLVALDTGSDLFWLPCDCRTCARSVNLTSTATLELNIYSPSTSSSSQPVPCNSTMCGARRRCAANLNACEYQEVYLSANTSTRGILVDDVLHLGTESNPQKRVEVPITLGCGLIQTGDFIDRAGINGLFGLGMDNISVPSLLASKGLTANSFSMCFGRDRLGRIEFGDKGSSDQQTTPFNLESIHPTYNVTITQVAAEKNVTDLEFTALFDSGTSFTYLNDPAYSVIVDSFTSQLTEPRYQPQQEIIFDYCYALSANQQNVTIPSLNFTMNGGSKYVVNAPVLVIPRPGGLAAYCLAIVKSENVNIIGQNFMSGYRIVFDREEMVLGWKDDDCYGSPSSGNALPVDKSNSTGAPSPSVIDPRETPAGTNSPVEQPLVPRAVTPSPPSPSVSINGSGATAIFSCTANRLLMLVVSLCLYQFVIFSP